MEGQLRAALAEIERPGTFVVQREVPASALQLEVRGVGPVTFPISATTARALCASALLARHGFKEQTRLDRTVRDTWEIAKAQIKIDQKRWHEVLVPELDRIRQRLGLASNCTLRAELHNLLVYEPGQFFVPHQDSEKEEGMIGTLVVILPSKFSGGTTIVKHHDEKIELRGPHSELSLVAFYADCHHEVRPVKNGYRVVLTYNLLLSATGKRVEAPAFDQTLGRLESCVREFFEPGSAASFPGARPEPPPDRLVYLLDHQYTQKGLSWSHLKNADATRVAALGEVARRLDCEVALALADVHETWSCEEEDRGYGRSWRRRGYEEDDPDSGAPVRGNKATPELVELHDWDVELRHLVDARGKAGAASGCVLESELCYTKPSVDLNPFKSEHEGYMGNWGNTVDRWYHRAAVVLWPRERTFIIRAKTSAKFALEELRSSLNREGIEVTRRKTEQLMPFWGDVWREANDSRLTAKTLSVALELNCPELAFGLILPLSLENLTSRHATVVVDLLERYSFEWLEQALAGSSTGHSPKSSAPISTACLMLTICR
jgi:2OG-Fe(II) oxygenase superfamily